LFTRLVRLSYLAPDIKQAILDGRHLLSRVPYQDLNPVHIALPPRQSDSDYTRPKLTSQHFVPDIYEG